MYQIKQHLLLCMKFQLSDKGQLVIFTDGGSRDETFNLYKRILHFEEYT